MKSKGLILSGLSLAIAAALAPQSQAAVMLQDSYAPDAVLGAPTDLGGGTFGYEFNLDPTTEFSAAGHSKLVMVFSSKNGGNGGAAISNISYDGEDLQEAVVRTNNPGVRVGIFYLDDVATDGTLRVELASNNAEEQFIYGLYAVDGLAPGVADTANTGSFQDPVLATVTLNTPTGFLVQESARNNQNVAALSNDYTTLYEFNDTDPLNAISQYQIATSAGDYFAATDLGGARFRNIAAAAFDAAEVVPEPTSLLVGAIGLGGLIARRRRLG